MIVPFPSPLTTERLIIRTPEPGDAAQLHEAVAETFDQLRLWMPWAKTLPSLEDSLETCTRMANDAAELKDFVLFGFDRESGQFVLASGCHMKDPEVPFYEIGYWCRASCQGRGYVKETVHAITRTAFEELGARRLEIRCDERNQPSRAVAEKCGFELQARFECHCRDNQGGLRTTLVYALTRPDQADVQQIG